MKKTAKKSPANTTLSDAEERRILEEFKEMLKRNTVAQNRRALRVNPKGHRMTIGELIITQAFEPGCEINFSSLGERFAYMLKNYDADKLEESFKRIVKAKREQESLPHRNFYAYEAYLSFKGEVGREPKKRELRRYILSRRSLYKDAPETGDKKGWFRVWQQSHLDHLEP
ncbi:MAG: hypothetical protein EAZ81_10830 [Verrucomicrobia bacterium]|nr:MAG: hypothetical protein EAZ81_10830 [Verrucomicrobiota bacterium]